MPDDESVVLEERHGGVLLLTLSRPEKHNAFNRAMHVRLAEALDQAERANVRVIVITGAGDRAFSAGADMTEAGRADRPPSGSAGDGQPAARTSGIARIGSTPLPVIAAVNGYCYGGGALLAIISDIRLASENATFRLPGSEYGLVVAASTLPRLVGAAKAKELIYLTKVVDADEALRIGLVNAVYPQSELVPAAIEMAQRIAGFHVGAIQAAKRVIDAATLSDEAREIEAATNRELRGSPEQVARFNSAADRVTGRSRRADP